MRNPTYLKAEICIPKSYENVIKSKIPTEFLIVKRKEISKILPSEPTKIGNFEYLI